MNLESEMEIIWLVHKGGFAAAKIIKSIEHHGDQGGSYIIRLEHGSVQMEVSSSDIEKVTSSNLFCLNTY